MKTAAFSSLEANKENGLMIDWISHRNLKQSMSTLYSAVSLRKASFSHTDATEKFYKHKNTCKMISCGIRVGCWRTECCDTFHCDVYCLPLLMLPNQFLFALQPTEFEGILGAQSHWMISWPLPDHLSRRLIGIFLLVVLSLLLCRMQNETSELIKEKKGRCNTDPGDVWLDISSIGILS